MATAPSQAESHGDRVRRLHEAVFSGDGTGAARVYEEILQYRPQFLCKASVQFELARLLERSGEKALALVAYEKIALTMPRHPAAPACLLGAGLLAAQLKKIATARKHLEEFLATDPQPADRQRAIESLESLPDGQGARDITINPSYDAFRRLSGEVRLPSMDEETLEKKYRRLRDAHFAVVLPPGKRIAPEDVAAVIADVESIPEAEAKAAVVERKGIVFPDLVLEDLFEVWLKTEGKRDYLLFVATDRDLKPLEVLAVNELEPTPKGLRLSTAAGPRHLRWEDIRLMSAGRLDRRHTLDIFTAKPTRVLRVQALTTRLPTLADVESQEFNDAFRALCKGLAERAPRALQSFTLDKFLADEATKPQKFAQPEEFDHYNRWLLFGHFAEKVNVEELIAEAQTNDNW